jgi:ABC-2 type transport system ATP-binding protein
MSAVVRAAGLTKSYGRDRGIIDLGFEVGAAEVFGFLGPNEAVTSHRTPEPSDSPGS